MDQKYVTFISEAKGTKPTLFLPEMKEKEILTDYLHKIYEKLEDLSDALEARPRQTSLPHPDLSKREQEIFDLIGKGEDSSAIAEQLGLNVQTVHSYRHRIKQKLNINSNNKLLFAAFRHVHGMSKESETA